jgi:hypothetical protein
MNFTITLTLKKKALREGFQKMCSPQTLHFPSLKKQTDVRNRLVLFISYTAYGILL